MNSLFIKREGQSHYEFLGDTEGLDMNPKSNERSISKEAYEEIMSRIDGRELPGTLWGLPIIIDNTPEKPRKSPGKTKKLRRRDYTRIYKEHQNLS